MTQKLFLSSLRTNCLGEFIDSEGNETVLYIDFNELLQTIEVGDICNSGLIVKFTFDYDGDFSIDENLQYVIEELYNNGYNNID